VFSRLFFVRGYFQLASAETVASNLTLNTLNGVLPRKDVFSRVQLTMLPIINKNLSKTGVNRQLSAKSQNNYTSILSKLFEPNFVFKVIKATTDTSRVVPHMRTKNSRWRMAAILKFQNFKNANNSATVQPIATKFCRNMWIATATLEDN